MMLRPKTWLAAARAAAGYSAPLLPFTSFPAALTVEGQIRRPEELPHVELIAIGGIWRPRGGRQVLAQRYVNPVTLQSLTEQRAETLGPFPGGLVRAGMQLRLSWAFRMPALGTSTRRAKVSVGPVGHAITGKEINHVATGTSNSLIQGELQTYLNVLSDGNGTHDIPNAANLGGISSLTGGYISAPVSGSNWSGDFSQPWDMGLWLLSAAETATNITSVSWSGGVAVFVNPSHTLNTGDKTTVAGVSVGGYNGVYSNITRIDDNTWSGTLVANPGGAGTGGTSSRISNVISQSYSLTLEG